MYSLARAYTIFISTHSSKKCRVDSPCCDFHSAHVEVHSITFAVHKHAVLCLKHNISHKALPLLISHFKLVRISQKNVNTLPWRHACNLDGWKQMIYYMCALVCVCVHVCVRACVLVCVVGCVCMCGGAHSS